MEYFLMRKDDVVTLCEISANGTMIAYSPNFRNPELAPLEYKSYKDHIIRWWNGRQIPIRQGRIEEMLRERGLAAPGAYLIRNLGLSLTDFYWMKPVDSSLKWADVNLFDNDFKENLMEGIDLQRGSRIASCTPNSSLRGELEKSWVIRRGKRILIKGNRGVLSVESMNEVIATELHKKQKYDNYTTYRLIRIRNRPYDYGCCSEAFTSNQLEFVSAHAILTSVRKPAGLSSYEFLIERAADMGIDARQFRRDLEYQIMTDYLLSNVDRHMDNIGILRDANTLKPVRMAPIFDTGRAFGGGGVIPYTESEIDGIETNSFEHSEKKLLALVTEPDVLDMSRLPESEMIEELYSRDSHQNKWYIESAVRLYKKKAERLIGML